MTLIGILVLIAIIWLLVVLIGGLPPWLLVLLLVLVVVWFVGGQRPNCLGAGSGRDCRPRRWQAGAGRRVPAGPDGSDLKFGKLPVFWVTWWNVLCLIFTVTGPDMKVPS